MPRIGSVSFVPVLTAARHLAGPSIAVIFVVIVTIVRIRLGDLLPGLTVFSLYYPAILGAALIGGGASAALALLLSSG
jgi:hypothetical protein